MIERPILFSAPMVRAILEDRKTQTRRVARTRRIYATGGTLDETWMPMGRGRCIMLGKDGTWPATVLQLCPYGKPGDRLWVRETWLPLAAGERKHLYRATDAVRVDCHGSWYAVADLHASGGLGLPVTDIVEGAPPKWRPSIHMPRVASRTTLEVTEVRIERLKTISEEDARAEGVAAHNDDGSYTCGEKLYHTEGQIYTRRSAVEAYRNLWERINGKGSWGKDPWVWVVNFKRVEGGQ